MELVRGGELFDAIVKNRTLNEIEAKHIFRQLLDGVGYMHAKHVIHRDLKPENILIDSSRELKPPLTGNLHDVKIADFGLSKIISEGTSFAKTFVGTPQYWAPEVLNVQRGGGSYTQAADFWSLGAVLYVMLGGKYPFDGKKMPLEEQIRTAAYSMTAPAWQRVSEEAKDMVRGLLKVDPVERFNLEVKCVCDAKGFYGAFLAEAIAAHALKKAPSLAALSGSCCLSSVCFRNVIAMALLVTSVKNTFLNVFEEFQDMSSRCARRSRSCGDAPAEVEPQQPAEEGTTAAAPVAAAHRAANHELASPPRRETSETSTRSSEGKFAPQAYETIVKNTFVEFKETSEEQQWIRGLRKSSSEGDLPTTKEAWPAEVEVDATRDCEAEEQVPPQQQQQSESLQQPQHSVSHQVLSLELWNQQQQQLLMFRQWQEQQLLLMQQVQSLPAGIALPLMPQFWLEAAVPSTAVPAPDSLSHNCFQLAPNELPLANAAYDETPEKATSRRHRRGRGRRSGQATPMAATPLKTGPAEAGNAITPEKLLPPQGAVQGKIPAGLSPSKSALTLSGKAVTPSSAARASADTAPLPVGCVGSDAIPQAEENSLPSLQRRLDEFRSSYAAKVPELASPLTAQTLASAHHRSSSICSSGSSSSSDSSSGDDSSDDDRQRIHSELDVRIRRMRSRMDRAHAAYAT
ncbi:unnamed protein product [Polarella glacialis]|uniref:Protein kinase domain-containing protein n=1 Tax=Polarella glacialis TaxID=89957 RepID=A0A813HS06_POLGL|nr:unnamed protein product [Polarella glacialis]